MRAARTTTSWVPLDSLKFDHAVNPRTPDQARRRVDAIVRDFDPDKLGYLTVSRRDQNGTYVVLDGQHRVAALRRLGYDDQKVECRVYEGLTAQQEADIFLGLNTVRTMSAIHQLLAGIAAGRQPEADIARIVESLNLRIGDQCADGQIAAAKALRVVYGGGRVRRVKPESHPKLLQATLRLILSTWGRQQDALAGQIIEGVGFFLARYGSDVEVSVLVEKLAKNGTPNKLIGEGRALRSAHDLTLSSAIAWRITDIYNKGRVKNRLASWLSR